MSLLDGLKEAIVEVLRPGTRQQLGERDALKQMYQNSNAQNILPDQWYRLYSQSGACVGFSYCCPCMREWQFISAFEWQRDYVCPQCKSKFDLLRFVGIKNSDGTFKVDPAEWETLLAKLPVRPRLAGGPPRTPFIDTWDNSDSTVGYELSDPGGLPRR
jgi:hypothetical protein